MFATLLVQIFTLHITFPIQIFGSIWLIAFGRPVLLNKVLLLITIYLFGAVFLANLNFYFVALSYIIVYIGAIAILFLFIIMICDNSAPLASTSGFASLILPPFLFLASGAQVKLHTIPSTIWHPTYFKTIELFDINSLSIVMFNGWPVLTALLVGILLTSCLIGLLTFTN